MIAEPIFNGKILNENVTEEKIKEEKNKINKVENDNYSKLTNEDTIISQPKKINRKIRDKRNTTFLISKDEKMWLKLFPIIVFVLGVVIGSICFRILINDSTVRENISQKFSNLDVVDTTEKEIMKNSFIKNIGILFVFWIAGISVVGAPLILVLCFYKGFSTALVICSFLLKYGFYKGNIFIFKNIFPYYIFLILGIVVLTGSSLKVSANVLREKKDIRYEILRHSIVTILSAILFYISSVIEAKILFSNF